MVPESEILKNVSGNKDGYFLQRVAMPHNNFAETDGKKIRVKGVGIVGVEVTITLRHRDYADVTRRARFTVAPGRAPNLNFNNFTRSFSGNKTITTQQILDQIVGGDKTNYSFRSISITSSTRAFAEIENPAPFFTIKIKKAGVFTATITLRKENYEDVILNNCEFNITKIAAPTGLSFPVFKTVFANNKIISERQILNNISENIAGDKTGYSVKSISGLSRFDGRRCGGN